MSEKVIRRDIEAKDGVIKLQGSCLVKGNVLGGGVSATDDIKIEGTVIDGHITTSGGNITITQGIEGESTQIEAFGDIRADYCHGGIITSKNGSAYFNTRITNSKVIARNLVHVDKNEGMIFKSTIKAGLEIITNKLGNKGRDATYAILSNERQQEMFELMLVYEQKLKEKKKRLEKLFKVIKIIRLLGEKVVKLPPNKKEELAKQVQEFKQVKKEIEETNIEKQKVIRQNQEMKKYTRAIIVHGNVYPNVQINIDKLKYDVIRNAEKVIFYKTGIIIMGDLDQFKLRQR